MADPDLPEEIAKITEIILPESKIPKAVRLQQEQDDDIVDGEEVEEDGTDTEEEKDEGDDTLSLFDPDDEI
jgi:hypothetical protein